MKRTLFIVGSIIAIGALSTVLFWQNILPPLVKKTAHQPQVLINEQQTSVSSFEGHYLHTILDVDSLHTQSFILHHKLNKPFVILVVKEINCGSCYTAVVNMLVPFLNRRYFIALITIKEIEKIERDFKKRIILFPPPLTARFLDNFPDDLALFCVQPNGLIIHAISPDINRIEEIRNFCERTESLILGTLTTK
jgi:hypothetical protein